MIKAIDKILNKLFPLNRSLTGNANILTLNYIKNYIPIKIKKIDSGKKVFDWKVPMEWELEYGYIIDLNTNKKIISSKESNLHIVSYSSPINKIVNFNELKKHLHYDKIKDAIPYRTTYYSKEWGFCITKNQFNKLTKYKGPFHVLIKSKFKKSNMPYGELVIKGKSKKEFLISTYICHPSLANDNLSGIVATIFLAKKILLKKNLKYTYRIIFIPETIGAIAYSYLNLKKFKNIFSGLVVANVGGPGSFSFKESYDPNHFLNSLIKKVFNDNLIKYKKYDFDINGSDERQFSSVGIRINCCSIFKDKYYEYNFYHTSKDDLNFVKSNNIFKSINLYNKLFVEIEKTRFLLNLKPYCEIMLSKYNLYPKIGGSFKPNKLNNSDLENLKWILFLSDGKKSVAQIAEKLKIKKNKLINLINLLIKKNLIKYE